MRFYLAVSLCALAGLGAAEARAAEGDACLQNNRIWSWRVVDSRTLEVDDVSHKPFTVRLTGPCIGLDNALSNVAFHGTLSLGCLQSGDQVIYRPPALGRQSCFIDSVTPGKPPKPADKPHND
jgi:hypothetical protein